MRVSTGPPGRPITAVCMSNDASLAFTFMYGLDSKNIFFMLVEVG